MKTVFTKTNWVRGVAMLLIAVFVYAPLATNAATDTFRPQTNREMIAYLYGRIAQLLEMKEMLERGGVVSRPSDSDFAMVAIDTHRAAEIEDTTAVLRGEVLLYGGATASVWFEYGQDTDFLDQKTRRVSVRSAYDRAVRVQVGNLEEEERYYYRIVAVDQNDFVYYGPIFGFRTDESD